MVKGQTALTVLICILLPPLSLSFLLSEKKGGSSSHTSFIGEFIELLYIKELVQHARYIVSTQFI